MTVKDFLTEIKKKTKGYEDYEIQIEVDFMEDPNVIEFKSNNKKRIVSVTFGCCGL